jgi:fermentation-respiration switch protein FrsA (DUF1100 family)
MSPFMLRVLQLVVIVAAVWLYLRFFEWRNLYHPTRRLAATPAVMGLEFEDVFFMTEDGRRLHGWWIPSDGARGTIIYCHGNAGNIGDRVAPCADLLKLDLNVFIFDYRGYGLSRGIPNEKGTYRDARAAYEVVRARYDDTEDPPVIIYGGSLGGAVAIQLALDKNVRGLILENTFPSVIEVGERLYPWLPIRWFSRYRYDSTVKVPDLRVPKLFAHSMHDQLIPYDMGRRLFEKAAEPKQFITLQGYHEEATWNETPTYWRAMEVFVTSVLGPKRDASQ